MGIKFAAALGGINFNGLHITTDTLPKYQDKIKRELADKEGMIETYFNGKTMLVTWGWGHFGTLKDIKDYNPEWDKWDKISLPFFPKKFECKRRENKNPNKEMRDFFNKRNDTQFRRVRELFNRNDCEYIINATDWGREGELIFAYTYDLTGTNKPYFRLRNNAKTEKQIQKDFCNLVSAKENLPYVYAARSRSIADWIIGINLTIGATRYLSKDNSCLYMGRVLTPTLNLIVSREEEIINFVEKTTYTIDGLFEKNGEYKGRIILEENFEKKEDAEKLASMLAGEKTAKMESFTQKNSKKYPPLLYNTTTIQVDANKIYGFTLDKTLKILQSLYEAGYTTYPRVDSEYLTEDKVQEIPELLRSIYSYKNYGSILPPSKMQYPKKYFDNSKVEDHDAIIITGIMPKNLSEDQDKIYDLIIRRMAMASCEPAEIQKTEIITSVDSPANNEIYRFKTSNSVVTSPGFTLAEVTYKKNDNENSLPSGLKEGQIVNVKGFAPIEQISKPPVRFTDGTLIQAMENCARKVDDETFKDYLKRSKGIGRPSTRASIIERLISSGFVVRKGKTLSPTSSGINTIHAIPIEDIKSPVLTAKWEQSLDEIEHKSPSDSVKEMLVFIDDIKRTTNTWIKEMDRNKIAKEPREVTLLNAICPCCGQEMVVGRNYYFCKDHDDCGFMFAKNISGKAISKSNAEKLCKTGETNIISGFKSKSGKPFSAKLKLEDKYKCTNCGKVQSKGSGSCYACHSPIEKDDNLIISFEFQNNKKR